MKRYEVQVKEIGYASTIIEANSKEEAEDIAYNDWADGKIEMNGNIDCQTKVVDEL